MECQESLTEDNLPVAKSSAAMPIRSEFELPRLTAERMGQLDYQVMKHAFASHSDRGRLCDESVYQHDLVQRLLSAGISAEIEVPVALSFRDFATTLRIDLLVERQAIYELKTVEALTSVHEGQCLAYLFMTNTTRGKLVNFRPKSVEARFVNTSRTTDERRRFDMVRSDFSGSGVLSQMVEELVGDWGTGLSAAVYRKAILHCAGDEMAGDRILPMTVDGRSLGNQRFHLLDGDTALGVTTYADDTHANGQEFEKLISTSPLRQMHWVNITHGHVQLATIRNDRKI
jgi:GxxExxY protein